MADGFFIKNREKLFNSIEDSSVIVLFNGHAPVKRGDEFYPFSPDRNFYYVTGVDSQNTIAVFRKNGHEKTVSLYIERDNGYLAKWVGANITPEQAKDISGIYDIGYVDQFKDDLAAYIFKNNIENIYLDLENRSFTDSKSPALEFSLDISGRYPHITIKNAYSIFSKLRVIKEDYEIKLIKDAINVTKLGFEEMMKNAKAGMYEYEIEAYFDFIVTKMGAKDKAFKTIAASGQNGTILHYSKNNSKTSENELILVDAGAQVGYYNGDITRTFPVNGKFTQRQRLIYNVVLNGQFKVIDAIKPGITINELNEMLKDHYYECLKDIGIVKIKDDVSKYYYHSISHYLGAETHDIGYYKDAKLEPGMVITVEPGLYIDEWAIGIRIEDDVLVTESGCEVLSSDMIKTVEDIENFMGS